MATIELLSGPPLIRLDTKTKEVSIDDKQGNVICMPLSKLMNAASNAITHLTMLADKHLEDNYGDKISNQEAHPLPFLQTTITQRK